MKTLYLLRHAEAIEGSPMPDIERPLTTQGRADAQALAIYLGEINIACDLVMCSAALRTQETLAPLRPLLSASQVEIASTFYNLSEEGILESIREVPDTTTSILYIGHNPGISFVMFGLAQDSPELLQEGAVAPATLIGLQFSDEKWADLRWGRGQVVALFQPGLAAPGSLAQKEW